MSQQDHDPCRAPRRYSLATDAEDFVDVARELAKHADVPLKPIVTRIQVLIFAACLLGVIGFYVGRELLYLQSGKTIDAKVTRQFNEQRSNGRHGIYNVVVADYSFVEASGRQRQERDEIRFGSGPSIGETVPVEYVPGIAGFSRIRGKPENVTPVVILCGSPLLILLGICWFSFRPRYGGIVFWIGIFLVSAIDAVFMSITLFRDDSLPRDWLGILAMLVGLVFAAIGVGGMWLSGLWLWRSTRKKT